MVEPQDQLLALLSQQADVGYIGEPVSQLDHALQCASLARNAGADEPLVLAALLHDIGHVCDPRAQAMGDYGVRHHEQVGADYLRTCGVDEAVASLVEQHVNAKRYLVATNDAYGRKLSDASKATLEYQGGPMSDTQVALFEQLPRFADLLRLRAWDEAAKQADASPPCLADYAAMLRRNCSPRLTPDQQQSWRQRGYLKLSDWFSEAEVGELVSIVSELQTRPDTAGFWMKYYEEAAAGRQLCRVENFVDFVPALGELAMGEAMLGLVSSLMTEPVVLFKDKLNVKLPGGNGFAAHQDAPAFTTFNQQRHITVMVSVDETTIANGCLQVAAGRDWQALLAMNADLTLSSETESTLDWTPVPTRPGDLLLFDSYLPHRSHANNSTSSRRALYLTFNRLSEGGDVRRAYFDAKRAAFPPDIEREPGRHYDPGVFNVGNPVKGS